MRTLKFNLPLCPIFILLGMFFSIGSEAGLQVEPYLGLAKQEIHIGELADIADSFGLGVKIGVTFASKYFIGGDYLQAGPYKFGPLLSNYEMTNTMLGIVAGLDYKIIRFWVGYYVDDEFSVSAQGLVYKGTAMKAAFGLIASQKFRANLELIFHDITKSEQFGFSTELTDYKFNTTMVTLSIPISLD